MTARYRQINPTQEPFDLGLDENKRSRIAFNITVVKTPSDFFIEELVWLLENAVPPVGAYESDIFATTAVTIPDGVGPYLVIVETGGATPERTHNEINPPAYQRPSAQFTVHAKKYSEARTMIRAAYDAVVGVRNQIITAIP